MKIYEIVAGNKLSTILKFYLLQILIYSLGLDISAGFPLWIWDESRLAINAHEMYRDGGCLVTSYEEKIGPFGILSHHRWFGFGVLAMKKPME